MEGGGLFGFDDEGIIEMEGWGELRVGIETVDCSSRLSDVYFRTRSDRWTSYSSLNHSVLPLSFGTIPF